jgi:hypothetical protein
LGKFFKISDLGVVQVYLGMNVAFPKPGVATISQKTYINKMVTRFKLEDAKVTRQPLPSGVVLTKKDSPTTDKDKQEMANIPYRGIIGSLLYSSLGTRPDIAYAVAALSRFNNNPGLKHWKYAKAILRYLKGTPDLGLVYKNNGASEIKIEIFSDSDWGSNADDRKSISGFVVCVNGNPISWSSRTQKSTALSSCEAEFMALSEAMREALWLRQLLIEVDIGFVQPITIRVDNQSAIKLAENPVQHQRSKHIDIRYMRIQEEIKNGNIQVIYVPTEANIADLLTKSPTFQQFSTNLPFLIQET